MDEETLWTCLVKAEKIVNDRPLTPGSSDVNECQPIRPSDLLRVRDRNEVDLGDSLDRLAQRRQKWIGDVTQAFWKRWRSEHLQTLQLRRKWLVPGRNYQVGDLVIVWKESVPKGYWPMGIVTRASPGHDGLDRTLEIRTGGGLITRDVRRICLLEGAP